jgi:hypothetical protein
MRPSSRANATSLDKHFPMGGSGLLVTLTIATLSLLASSQSAFARIETVAIVECGQSAAGQSLLGERQRYAQADGCLLQVPAYCITIVARLGQQ